jgi:hypothetical protein
MARTSSSKSAGVGAFRRHHHGAVMRDDDRYVVFMTADDGQTKNQPGNPGSISSVRPSSPGSSSSSPSKIWNGRRRLLCGARLAVEEERIFIIITMDFIKDLSIDKIRNAAEDA